MTIKTVWGWSWLATLLGFNRSPLPRASLGERAAARAIFVDLEPQRPAPLTARGTVSRRASRHWRAEALEMSRRLSSHL